MKRGSFLASSAAALTSRAAAADESGATTVRIGASPDEDMISVVLGMQYGLFQKYGVNPTLVRLASGAATIPAVLGGSIDIGKSSTFTLIRAYVQKIPIVIEESLAIYDAAAPNVAFVVAKGSPIKSARDLSGKTIAVPALGDLFTVVTSEWIDRFGGDSHSVRFIELPTNASAAAIAGGRVDGSMIVNPMLASAIEVGGCRILGYPYDIVARHFGLTFFFCTQDYAHANGDLLARFRRGFAEAVAYTQTHRSEAIAASAKFTGIDAGLIQKMPLVLSATLSPDQLQPVIDFSARYNMIPSAFRAQEFMDAAALHGGLS